MHVSLVQSYHHDCTRLKEKARCAQGSIVTLPGCLTCSIVCALVWTVLAAMDTFSRFQSAVRVLALAVASGRRFWGSPSCACGRLLGGSV